MHAGVDFETYYDKEYSLRKMGAWNYVHDERFDCYLVAIHSPTYTYCGSVEGADWSKIIDMDWVSHNMSFDALVARRLGIPLPKNWYCTADMSVYFKAPRDLKGACWQLMSHKVDKEYRGTALGKQWPNDYTQEERQQIIDAGEGDAQGCWMLWDRFNKYWPAKEKKLSVMTAEMGWRGVHVDQELLDYNIRALKAVRWKATTLIPWVEQEGDTVYSRKQLKEWAATVPDIKWVPASLAQDSEERERWEWEYGDKFPAVGAMRDWNKANMMYRKLEKIQDRLTPDGRMPYSLFYFGAHTGRWSGSGGWNTQNMNNNELLIDTDNWTIVWPGVTEVPSNTHSIRLRQHFIAAPGKKLIVCDLSQIEPRVAAKLAGDEEFLDFIRSGHDPYTAHALTMGWKGDKLEGDDRKGYKAQVLGLGYGCWIDAYISVAEKMCGLVLDPKTAKSIILEFRHKKKKLVEQWENLDDDLWSCVRKNTNYTVTLPNGRTLEYFNLHRKIAKPRNQIRGNVVRGGKSSNLYGAKLWENVVQATSRDVFAEHLLTLEYEKKFPVVLQAHDEAVLEVDKDVTVEEVEAVMSQCPDWLPGLPVASEGFETQFYRKG